MRDPEHPVTLVELEVVAEEQIEIHDAIGADGAFRYCAITLEFTPTVKHCSLATLIGLCIRVQLLRVLGEWNVRFKLALVVSEGSHDQDQQVTRQVNDKERVAAAMQNPRLVAEVERCLAPPVY